MSSSARKTLKDLQDLQLSLILRFMVIKAIMNPQLAREARKGRVKRPKKRILRMMKKSKYQMMKTIMSKLLMKWINY